MDSKKRPAACPKGLDISQPVVHLEGFLGTIPRQAGSGPHQGRRRLSRPKQPFPLPHHVWSLSCEFTVERR